METKRETAVTFGILLIAAIVCGIFSSVPAVEEADYLTILGSDDAGVLSAVLFQAMMAIIYVAITVITYPIVKLDNEQRALAYLAFRIIGAAFLFIGIVTLLLLLALSRQYLHAGAAGTEQFEMAGALLRQARDWLNHIGMILPWSIGGVFLYVAFLRAGLIPRWMSIWGLAGVVLTLVATVLYMLGQIELVSVAYFALNMPTALFELSLAGYLIVKGFHRTENSQQTIRPRRQTT